MKKRILYIILAVIICLIFLFLYEVQRLKLLMGNEPIEVIELTSDQKAKDMAYMFDVIEEVYPFTELNVNIKGLTNLLELRENFISRAAETKNNEEFLRLVVEVTDYIRQSGHGGIRLNQEYSFYHAVTQNIPKDAYNMAEYWRGVGTKLDLYVHSDIRVIYCDGEYVLDEDYENEDVRIPAGSVIKTVDSVVVDDYVRSLEAYQTLGYDKERDKLFAYQLFMTDPTPRENYWQVEVQIPDKVMMSFELLKKRSIASSPTTRLSNLSIVQLNDTTAYFNILSFAGENILNDGMKMKTFFSEHPYQFNQLIIDLRNNGGGEITYWIENLIKPMIDEPVELISKTAVRKSYEKRMGYHLWLYRKTTANDLLDEFNGVVKVKKIIDDLFDPMEWKVYRILKRFEPKNRYAFDGRIILLTNQQTLSAADSYVNAVKQLGIGKVIGLRTGGWGNHYSGPMTFSLPESGIMFYMDVEVALNDDGLPTSIYGTDPDVIMESFIYPTPCINMNSKEAVLEDSWIQWVLENH